MNWQRLAAQLIRTRRGSRTQQQLSRDLGYKSNTVFAWENEHDEPNARAFFLLAHKTGEAPLLEVFFKSGSAPDLTTREGISLFLKQLLGKRKISELSKEMDRDRHAVGRWIRGQTEISLPDLLHFIETTTHLVYDFLGAFVPVSELDEAAHGYAQLEEHRADARNLPWANALLQLCCLESYKELPAHAPGWFANRLGISLEQEQESLKRLTDKGALKLCEGRYELGDRAGAESHPDPAAGIQVEAFWLREATRRLLDERPGDFTSQTFTLSYQGLEQVRELQKETQRRLNKIIAKHPGKQTAASLSFQLLPLEAQDKNAD